MAYSVNGKVYTDSPMLDELVYNSKLILKGIVIKNESLALEYETEATLLNAEYLYKCSENKFSIFDVPFSIPMLMEFGYTVQQANDYILNRELIPEEDKNNLLAFANKYYIDNYEETNKYYRSLLGLPEYDTNIYDIYINQSWIPEDYPEEIDYAIPLHLQSINVISLLQTTGKIDELINKYRSFNYSYLKHLGDNKLNIYKIRKANKWDILHMPPIEGLVANRFQEFYNKNKDIYLNRFWQDAYEFESEYYEHTMILMVLCQTFQDIITDTPDWYIRRDIFDIRSVEYFLESYGVQFFKEIPLKYQTRIVKNLNKLLKYKSSNSNNEDILEIFGLSNTAVFKYYLYKEKISSTGVLEDDYELKFIQCKLGDSFDNYIKNNSYKVDYDSLTRSDLYWDGIVTNDDAEAEKIHAEVKHQILEKDFSIEPSKYMSVRSDIQFADFIEQMEFVLSLLIDSKIDTDDLTVPVPSISEGLSFKASNLFLLIYIFTNDYYGLSNIIKRPEDVQEEIHDTLPDYEPADGDYWQKREYPEIYQIDRYRVYGFNPEVDLDKVKEVIGRGYTNYKTTNHYDLSDFGVADFIVPDKINSFSDFIQIFNRDIACYHNIQNIITYKTDNKDFNRLARYVNDQLFTRHFDYDLYENKNTLVELLKSRDYILYSYYLKIMAEPDKDTRNEDIANALNDIINTLEYYLGNFDYLFSFTPITSFVAILKYVQLLIGFFKSYKVHFLNPLAIYDLNSAYQDNKASIHDTIVEYNIDELKYEKEFITDYIKYIIVHDFEDSERERYEEIVDFKQGFEPLPGDDCDYNGGLPSTANFNKDVNGGNPSSLYPYKMINGQKPYNNILDYWNIDGGNEENDSNNIIDGGEQYLNQNFINVSSIFTTKFNSIIEGGDATTNTFIYNNYYKRTYDDNKNDIVAIIAAFTGLEHNETENYYKEIWRNWMSISDFMRAHDNMDLYYIENILNDDLDIILTNDSIKDYEYGTVINISDMGNRDTSHIIYINDAEE